MWEVFQPEVRTIAKDMKFKNGPKNSAVGWTHASVSAIIIVPEVSLTALTVSTKTCGSTTTMFRLVAVAVAVAVEDGDIRPYGRFFNTLLAERTVKP